MFMSGRESRLHGIAQASMPSWIREIVRLLNKIM